MLKKIGRILFWCLCLGMLPLVLAGFFFSPSFIILAAGFFLFTRYAWPRITGKRRAKPLRASLLWTEVFVVLLTLIYYTTDQRKNECDFNLDSRIKPLLTYSQCLKMDAERAEECKNSIMDPYALAFFQGELLVAAGRDESTLVRIDPEKPGHFTSESLGDGNVQQIVVLRESGLAVMPRWKEKKKIMIYNLKEARAEKNLETGVTKLIGAERFGDMVFVLSEYPYLYRVGLDSFGIDEFHLPYGHNNLYDIKGDEQRKALFFTDWVWGLVFRFDVEKMEPDRQRFLGGVATGLALDEKKCELYVSNGIPGRIRVLDCETLESIRTYNVGFGGHEIVLSRNGEKIYLVKYFGGKYTEIDRDTGKILFETEVGGQTRDLLYDDESERLFLCSKCGIYEVEIK